MMETGFGRHASTYVPLKPACQVMQGHPEKNGLLNFLCDQSEMYGIMQSS